MTAVLPILSQSEIGASSAAGVSLPASDLGMCNPYHTAANPA